MKKANYIVQNGPLHTSGKAGNHGIQVIKWPISNQLLPTKIGYVHVHC